MNKKEVAANDKLVKFPAEILFLLDLPNKAMVLLNWYKAEFDGNRNIWCSTNKLEKNSGKSNLHP